MAETRPFDFPDDFDRAAADPVLTVDLDGFEGPLELLLELARQRKIDLHAISILSLADQYLAYVESAQRVRLELAADYLVMAAYLAYLKSRLMLPDPVGEDETAAVDLTADLAARLLRLDAMRRAAEALGARPRLGRDVFARGTLEAVTSSAGPRWDASLYELLAAYGGRRQAAAQSRVVLARRVVWSLAQARNVLERLVGDVHDWAALEDLVAPFVAVREDRRTVRASVFSAALEMVREGRLAVQQTEAFAPLYLRLAEETTKPSKRA